VLLILRSDDAAGFATVDCLHVRWVHLLVGRLRQNSHDHGASAVRTLVLAQVVGSRELLATVGALERLLVSVQRTVVTLQVFLTTEATAAERAHESLAWVIGQ